MKTFINKPIFIAICLLTISTINAFKITNKTNGKIEADVNYLWASSIACRPDNVTLNQNESKDIQPYLCLPETIKVKALSGSSRDSTIYIQAGDVGDKTEVVIQNNGKVLTNNLVNRYSSYS